MSESSTRAYNGSNINVEAEIMANTTRSTDDADPSYSLTRYLSDKSHYLPGHRPTQATTTESETRVLGEIRKFEAKFSFNSDTPNRS